jgi:hypothetical protein
VIHGALWTYIVPDDGSMPDFPTSGNPRSSVIDSNKKLISSAASPLTDKHKYPRKGEYCTILITWDHNDPPKSTDRIADLRKVTRGAAFIEITD